MSGIGYLVAGESAIGVEVEMRRLDTWFEGGMTRVDAVFVDVEGYEVAVLRGREGC